MGPCVALVLIILGIYHIFLAVYSYTSDSYQDMASSAIAGQGFMRNMFAASFPLFARQMFVASPSISACELALQN
jgi:phosphotransferase system  glucose/maltose/N-acetylglucosamine-specific IIC component